MITNRINARLSESLALFVEKMVGKDGLFETPSEYIRDLIRRDMERQENRADHDFVLAGYKDFAADRMFGSTGNFQKDMKILTRKEVAQWQ